MYKYQEAQVLMHQQEANPPKDMKWNPLEVGCINLNIDATPSVISVKVGIGPVVQNSMSKVIGAMAKVTKGI